MNEKQMALDNKIFECVVGSHLYGTNTEISDKDYVGLFIADKEYYFGMKEIEEVDNSETSKNINGKNNPDAVDCKYYEIRQFFKLLYGNNPNISELLFIPENNIIFNTTYYDFIKDKKSFFLDSELIKKKFQQYAFSQKKKMEVKLELLNKINEECILKNDIEKEINKKSSHYIRLLIEVIELLETKQIIFPLKERQLITDIKQGKYKMTEVLELSDELNNKIDNLKYEKFNNDYRGCNDILVYIIENLLKENKYD